MRWTPALTLLLLLACGPAAAPEEEAAARLTAGGALPATDRDPTPYTPPPIVQGTTGETVALTASGGEDQARRMLPALIEAVRDADEARLETLFADEVLRVAARSPARGQARGDLVQRILIYARRGIMAPETQVGELVELEALEVTRAAEAYRNRDMPELVRATDLVVEAPIRDAGRAPLRTVLSWQIRAHLIVRPGRDPRIIGY